MILFEKNISKQKESIGRHTLRYSVPNAIAIICSVITMSILSTRLGLDMNELFTILYFSTALLAIHLIYRIYCPINWYRGFVLVIDVIGLILATKLFWNWLALAPITDVLIKYILVIVACGIVLSTVISYFINRYLDKE